MKRLPYTLITLKNGLPLILQVTQANSVGLSIAVGAGSRFETDQTAGTAHFLEHMLFEGTNHFPSSKRIAEYIENAGGRSGAWTDKEYVSYNVKVPKQHLERSFAFMSEILFNSTLSNTAIQKEKGIISEEIKRKMDSPEMEIWDNWFEWVWGKYQPIGRSILGDEATLRKVTREQLQDYLNNFYHPTNMSIAVVGNFSLMDAEKNAVKYFGHEKLGKTINLPRAILTRKKIHTQIIKSDTQQIHQMLGFVTDVSYTHKDRFVLQLIADLLSAGASSRLFHKIIYEKGISYSSWVRSCTFTDNGLFIIYGAFSPKNISLAIKIIIEELKKVKEEKVSGKELLETKEKAKANINFSLETTDALSNWYAIQQITENRVMTIGEFEKRIDSVTPEDIIRVARKYFSAKNIRVTIKGPMIENVLSIEKLLSAL